MKLIVACDPNGGIGVNNALPWKSLKGDLARFKALTLNQIIVMGKNTWDSLPYKPLPNRLNVVITSSRIDLPDVLVSSSLNVLDQFPEAWLIGGAKLIETCWNSITEVHLSRTYEKYHCDTFIDLTKLNEFVSISTEFNEDHTYEIWRK